MDIQTTAMIVSVILALLSGAKYLATKKLIKTISGAIENDHVSKEEAGDIIADALHLIFQFKA